MPISPKAQRLIACLALRGPTPRPVVETLLWPQARQTQAAKGLRQSLWKIRKVTGDALLGAHGEQLELRAGVTLDITPASRLAERLARRAATLEESIGPTAAGLAGPAEQGMTEQSRWPCLDLELLPSWDGEEIERARERWDTMRLAALQRLGESCLAERDLLASLDYGRRAAAVDPFNERSQMITASALVGLGDMRGAWRLYTAYSDLVGAELGVDPSPGFLRIVTGVVPEDVLLRR
ncbi:MULTISPECIES: BTAD domain-containing putative transcriptional regulator [unclassified Nonomuraea]|uniref:AfsR/SARP family transcriptional regulator n=1 Tax=unclassified Nonomuraea TaxID=2593643 RepID=UPI0033CBD229